MRSEHNSILEVPTPDPLGVYVPAPDPLGSKDTYAQPVSKFCTHT